MCTNSYFHQSLIFADEGLEPALKVDSSKVLHSAGSNLLANIRLRWKWLSVTPACYVTELIKVIFMIQTLHYKTFYTGN
jgi:hypothetical protein